VGAPWAHTYARLFIAKSLLSSGSGWETRTALVSRAADFARQADKYLREDALSRALDEAVEARYAGLDHAMETGDGKPMSPLFRLNGDHRIDLEREIELAKARDV
jgi:hypothetical protein